MSNTWRSYSLVWYKESPGTTRLSKPSSPTCLDNAPPLDLKDTQLLLAQQVQQPAIDLRNPKLTPEVFLDLAWSLMTGRANHRRITIAHGRPRRTAYASPFAEWPVPYSSSVEASPGHWTGGVDTPASDCRRAQTHQEKRHPDWFEFISLPPSSLEGPPHLSIYSILP